MTRHQIETIRTVLEAGGIKQAEMRMGRARRGVVRTSTVRRLSASGHLELVRDFNGFMVYATGKGCRAVHEAEKDRFSS